MKYLRMLRALWWANRGILLSAATISTVISLLTLSVTWKQAIDASEANDLVLTQIAEERARYATSVVADTIALSTTVAQASEAQGTSVAIAEQMNAIATKAVSLQATAASLQGTSVAIEHASHVRSQTAWVEISRFLAYSPDLDLLADEDKKRIPATYRDGLRPLRSFHYQKAVDNQENAPEGTRYAFLVIGNQGPAAATVVDITGSDENGKPPEFLNGLDQTETFRLNPFEAFALLVDVVTPQSVNGTPEPPVRVLEVYGGTLTLPDQAVELEGGSMVLADGTTLELPSGSLILPNNGLEQPDVVQPPLDDIFSAPGIPSQEGTDLPESLPASLDLQGGMLVLPQIPLELQGGTLLIPHAFDIGGGTLELGLTQDFLNTFAAPNDWDVDSFTELAIYYIDERDDVEPSVYTISGGKDGFNNVPITQDVPRVVPIE